jgi:hypothetical protein
MFLITSSEASPQKAPVEAARVLVLVAGKKRTGKDTTFHAMRPLVARPEEFSFATPLKRFCIEVLGLTHDQCYGPDAQRETLTRYRWGDAGITSLDICKRYEKTPGTPMTAREVLQVFGTDLLRNGLYQNIWAEAGIREAVNSNAMTSVITDARFPNEMTAHTHFPGVFSKVILIRVFRKTGLEDTHLSETSLDSWDPQQGVRDLTQIRSVLENKGYAPVGADTHLWVWKDRGDQSQFTYLLNNNEKISDLNRRVQKILAHEGLI